MLVVDTNSYISVEDADTYFSERLNSDTWTNTSSTDKEKALIMSTRKVDRQRLRGIKYIATQTLEFPRAYYNADPNTFVNNTKINNFYLGQGWISQKSVPDNVKHAVCEEALILLQGVSKRIELQRQGVKSMSIDGLSESYGGYTEKLYSFEALEYLRPYLQGGFEIC